MIMSCFTTRPYYTCESCVHSPHKPMTDLYSVCFRNHICNSSLQMSKCFWNGLNT